jgi:hypothetical protein
VELLRVLITSYMSLSREALDLWHSEAEEFILSELSDAYQDWYGDLCLMCDFDKFALLRRIFLLLVFRNKCR